MNVVKTLKDLTLEDLLFISKHGITTGTTVYDYQNFNIQYNKAGKPTNYSLGNRTSKAKAISEASSIVLKMKDQSERLHKFILL